MNADTWLAALPPELALQRDLLERLLVALRRDARWRWLELGCSVAAGRGDALSDLDLGLGVVENAWPDAVDDLETILTGLGDTVDLLRHRLPEAGDLPHQRIFVQYANGAQIDLVAIPAGLPTGTQPENLILYDPEALRSEHRVLPTREANDATVREWTLLGWVALADLTKYLRRNSLWEALQRLEQARDSVWRLWAAAHNVPYPIYGLTSVLDCPDAGIPPGIENTVAGLDRSEILRAAHACAALLESIGPDHAPALAPFVRRQLQNT